MLKGPQDPVSTISLMKCLDACLDCNYFEFNGKIYHQHGGVSIGPKMAPPYACLGMGEFEKRVFESENAELEKLLIWKRFIDDIWTLFKGSREEAEMFMNFLNSLMPGVIKFTFKFSSVEINFLDISTKFIKEDDKVKIQTDLFIKPSNKQLFFQLCHVQKIFDDIVGAIYYPVLN